MYELASQDDCIADPDYDPDMCGFSDDPECTQLNGCGSPVAVVYLCSFTLLVSFILLNIFIAVILEGFANEKERMDGILLPNHVRLTLQSAHPSMYRADTTDTTSLCSRQQYDGFVTTWSLFDPEATGFIDWYILPSFIEALDTPMGFDKASRPSAKDIAAMIGTIFSCSFFLDMMLMLCKWLNRTFGPPHFPRQQSVLQRRCPTDRKIRRG
jgi:voltage-dependent calcium channel L type alpha-1D